MRAAAGVVAAVAALLAGHSPAIAQDPPPREFYGVVSQTLVDGADAERMAQGHVGRLRVTLEWAKVDRGAVPSGYDWSEFDEIVGTASRQGISVLPVIYSVPGWVSSIEGCGGHDCRTTPPHTAPGLNAWRAFLATAVRRYGPDGVFWATHPDVPELPIRVWQVWNEENDPGFFKPRPDVGRYAELLRAAADAIRGQDPGAEILLGGMCCHPLRGRDGGIRVTDYLRRLYDEPGIRAAFDGVAVHPYAKRIRTVRRQVDVVAALVHDELADPQAALWVTEIGWSSSRSPHPLNRGPRGQARRLRQAFGYMTRNRERLGLRAVLWYSWRDVAEAEAQCDWCALSGLFPASSLSRPKRAWRAFSSFTGGV